MFVTATKYFINRAPLIPSSQHTQRLARSLIKCSSNNSPKVLTTKSGITIKLPFDFNRIPVRKTPLKDMILLRFCPIEENQSHRNWLLELNRSQGTTGVNFEDRQSLPPLSEDKQNQTTHQDHMYLGKYLNPKNQKEEEYLNNIIRFQ